MASFGKDISAFGEAMGNYYSKVANIDTGTLSSVVTQVWSLVDLAKGLKGVDANSITSFSKALKSMADTGITEFTAVFTNSTTKVESAVQTMLNSVSVSITNSKNLTTPGMESVMTSLAEVVTQKAKEISASVVIMMTGFATTILGSSPTVQAAMIVVLSNTVSAINNMRGQFNAAGQNVGQGFINGIYSYLGPASSAGYSLGLAALNAARRALDSHSPSREFIHLGKNVGEGFKIGINNSIGPAVKTTSDMMNQSIATAKKGIETFEDWLDERKYYSEIALKEELAGWEQLQKQYKAGSEERKKIDREVYRVQNEIVKATYQFSIDWIEKEKFYNRLSTKEELEAYERMQKRYKEGSEERKKIDREIYTLKKQLVDEAYQYSMNWIDTEKYYNRMSLSDELAAYKRVQSRYAKGTEERKKMDREVYRVEKEIYEAQKQYISDIQSVQEDANQKRLDLQEEYAEKVKSIEEKLVSDIKSLNDKYEDALKSRENTLYQSYGLFDEVKEREEVSGSTLMKNLEDQVKEFSEWQDTLTSLSARGLSADLISELQQMGPSAISQIKALNSMSDSELEKYSSLWSVKHGQAREQAVGELEGLRIETQNNIAKLRVEAEKELEEYRVVWQKKMIQVTNEANAEIERLKTEFGKKVGLIKTDTEKEMQEMADAAQVILREAGWDESGKQVVTGITEGVESEKSYFLDTLTEMALEGVEAVRKTWDEHSPSRVFRKLGNYAGLGLVYGLSDYADKSYDAGAEVANSATDGLSNAISTINDLITSGMDMQPTIRPVIDLTNVSNASDALDNLFYPQRSIGLVGQTNIAFNASAKDANMTVTVENEGVIEELRVLRGELSTMAERMERMQIILDNGTLVGEMVELMDTALGQRISRRGRGN